MGSWMKQARKLEERERLSQNIPLRVETLRTQALTPGAHVWWPCVVTKKLLGPAVVDFIHVTEDGQTWVFVTFSGGWAAIAAAIITRIDVPPQPEEPLNG